MKRATIRTVCECQAALGAELDERRFVIKGWARHPRSGKVETAPAHSIHADREQFQVGWFCPFCVRNTLRSFDSTALSFVAVAPPPPASASPSVAPPSIAPSTAAAPSAPPPRPAT